MNNFKDKCFSVQFFTANLLLVQRSQNINKTI